MELVSRWGSPLTSQAPHSLAYPGPVKRRGHTTDLSDYHGSSAGPTHSLSLSVWSGRGQASEATKAAPHASQQWAPSRVVTSPGGLFFYVYDCRGWFCWFSKVTDSVAWTGCYWLRSLTLELRRQHDWFAAGWVTSITGSRWPTEQTQTWREVTDLRGKFHRFTISSFHPGLSTGCGCWKRMSEVVSFNT